LRGWQRGIYALVVGGGDDALLVGAAQNAAGIEKERALAGFAVIVGRGGNFVSGQLVRVFWCFGARGGNYAIAERVTVLGASGQFGVQAAPAWTGSLGPASPQRPAPRALTAAPEQPPWTQPRRGQDDQDIADYLSGLSTFPGSRGYGPGLPTFPAQDRT